MVGPASSSSSWIKNIAAYWTMMSLTIQSSRWEQSMNQKLVQMTISGERAISFHAASVENDEQAAMNLEISQAETAEAEALQEESLALIEKSNVDAAKAVSEQVTVEEVDTSIGIEQENSVAHLSAAAVDEATFQFEMEEAGVITVDATQHEAEAHSEELAIGLCEFIPLVDVVCDMVGGISAIGLEMTAASEALKASESLVAASIVKEEEENELALAAEFEAKVVEDTEASTALHAEIKELTELAEEERIQGEEDELAANELLEQAALKKENAAEKSAQAIAEEAEATAATRQALLDGDSACWDAIMANIVSFIALMYFSIRVLTSFVLPNMVSAMGLFKSPTRNYDILSTPRSRNTATATSIYCQSLGRDINYIVHHCGIFILTISSWATVLVGIGQNSLRARGGIILLFALTGGIVQTFLLHALPVPIRTGIVWPSAEFLCFIVLDMLKRMISLTVLFGIEILILWINLGKHAFDFFLQKQFWQTVGDETSYRWWLWCVLFVLIFVSHLWLLEEKPRSSDSSIAELEDTHVSCSTSSTSACDFGLKHEKSKKLMVKAQKDKTYDDIECLQKEPTESDSLLSSTNIQSSIIRLATTHNFATQSGTTERSTTFSLRQEFIKLQFPFEILVLSCMLQLILHCSSSIIDLWPVVKSTLLHVRPDWFLPFFIGCGILGVIWMIIILYGKDTNDQHDEENS